MLSKADNDALTLNMGKYPIPPLKGLKQAERSLEVKIDA